MGAMRGLGDSTVADGEQQLDSEISLAVYAGHGGGCGASGAHGGGPRAGRRGRRRREEAKRGDVKVR